MAVYTRNNIVTDGLVFYVDAANRQSYTSGSTSWQDISGNGTSGSLINGPVFNSDGGGSIVFDGINDYGDLNITSGLDANNITLNVVAKASENSNASLLYIFNQSSYLCIGNYTGGIQGPPNGESFSMVKLNPTNLTSTVRGGEYRFTDNKFHDFTFTRSNNIDNFYVDGTLVGSFVNLVPISSNLYPINIGQRISSPYFSAITSSIYKIYNRALSQAEVTQNYNAIKTRFGLT